MTEPLVSAEHLTVSYASSKGRALDDVSLRIHPGEVVAVVGESGSGKSTLAGALLGTLPRGTTITGRITVAGNDLLRLDARERRRASRQIGFVAQDPLGALNPCQRIGAQVAEPLRVHAGLSARAARRRSIELLEQVSLPERVARLYPHELSGGMRQRAAIAMAIALDPPLLVADEPTTALDATIQRQVLDLLDQLRRERNQALLLVSHDLAIVSEIADRILVLYAGRAAEERRAGELFEWPLHPYTAGLLGARPRLGTRSPPTPIPGSPPSSTGPEVACPFAPRCPRAGADCEAERPPFDTIGDGRVACHHPRTDRETAEHA